MIYMAGAPPHQDMYDLKMDAPSEMRGEFKPISTNVPGIQVCELLPQLAKIMDKCVPIRSLHGALNGSHDSFMCYTGKVGSTLDNNGQPPGGWPSIGAVMSLQQCLGGEGAIRRLYLSQTALSLSINCAHIRACCVATTLRCDAR